MDTKQGLNIFLQWSVLYAVTGFFSSLLLNNLPCTASFSTHCRLYGKWSYLWSIKWWRIIKPQVIKITIEFEWDNFENNEINNMFYLYDNVVSVLLFVFSVTLIEKDNQNEISASLPGSLQCWRPVHKLPVNDQKLARNFAKSFSKVAWFLKKLLVMKINHSNTLFRCLR